MAKEITPRAEDYSQWYLDIKIKKRDLLTTRRFGVVWLSNRMA
ncbi:MAG: hypothetical protein R2778_16625 [Saprospiraceae bacterium]